MNPTRILTVPGFGGTANLKSPPLRIPPRLRGGGYQSDCGYESDSNCHSDWDCESGRDRGRGSVKIG
jgi:hypothetical protein